MILIQYFIIYNILHIEIYYVRNMKDNDKDHVTMIWRIEK